MGKEGSQVNVNRYVRASSREVIKFAFNRFTHLDITVSPDIPKKGPYLAATNHASIADTLGLMSADPYDPSTIPIIKDSLSHIPGINTLLKAWDPIYTKRDGTDVFAVQRRINQILKQNGGVALAPEGTRSRSGRMEGLNPAAVNMILSFASTGVPVLACAVDSYDGIRQETFSIKIGPCIDLSPWTGKRLRGNQLIDPAQRIQDSIAALLPEEHRPLPGSSPLRTGPIVQEKKEPSILQKTRGVIENVLWQKGKN